MTASSSRPSTTRRDRDPRVDTLKGILILMVVIGHVVLRFSSAWVPFEYLYWAIYLVHMPAFAFASGLVIKDPARSARRAVRSLAPLYLGLSVMHVALRAIMVSTDYSFSWNSVWRPGILWFLLALMVWRLVLPWFRRLPRSMALSLSVVLALGIGFLDGWDKFLSVSRIVVFFPFFLAGSYVGLTGFARLSAIVKRPVGVICAAVILGLALVFTLGDGFRISQLMGQKSYWDTADQWWEAFLVRAAVIVCTALFVAAAASLISCRRSVLTDWGVDSIAIYIFHIYVVYTLDWVKDDLDGRKQMIILAVLYSAAAILISASTPVVSLANGMSRALIAVWDRVVTRPSAALIRAVGRRVPAFETRGRNVGSPKGPSTF